MSSARTGALAGGGEYVRRCDRRGKYYVRLS